MGEQTYSLNLAIILLFFFTIFIFLWIMPTNKSRIVIKRIVQLINAFPISKICLAIIGYFENKKKS